MTTIATSMINGIEELIEKQAHWIVPVFVNVQHLHGDRIPISDNDECMIAEPAINFINGKGFQVRYSEMPRNRRGRG